MALQGHAHAHGLAVGLGPEGEPANDGAEGEQAGSAEDEQGQVHGPVPLSLTSALLLLPSASGEA
jgi:hypothetical protein